MQYVACCITAGNSIKNKQYIFLLLLRCQKGSVEIILPKYYTFINDTSRGCIYILSL